MKKYKAEKNADLQFHFPDNIQWEELDKQGVKLPEGMKLVDLVIEREQDLLLVEIKDPSHSRSPENERKRYFKCLKNNSVLAEKLTPKARNSYLYLHLMERDCKPFKYVVLIGLDAFEPTEQKALLAGFKDRLINYIRHEAEEPWKRKHIEDCMVFSVASWNQNFPSWPVIRIGPSVSGGLP